MTRNVPGRSATNPPSGSIVAPAPLTDHCTDGSARPPPFAENRTTSPVRACDSRGSIVSAGTVLAATVTTLVGRALLAGRADRRAPGAKCGHDAGGVDRRHRRRLRFPRHLDALARDAVFRERRGLEPAQRLPAPAAPAAARWRPRLTSCGLMRIVAQPVLPLTMAPTFSSPGAKTRDQAFLVGGADVEGRAKPCRRLGGNHAAAGVIRRRREANGLSNLGVHDPGLICTRSGRGPSGLVSWRGNGEQMSTRARARRMGGS